MADRPKQLSNMSDEEVRNYQEPGIEEDTWSPGGILEPEDKIGKLARLFHGAATVIGGSRIARMAAAGPPASKAVTAAEKGLGALGRSERSQAVRETGRLGEIAENPAKYSEELFEKAKSNRANAQEMKDIRDRVRKPGGEISESPGLDYSTHQFPEEMQTKYGKGTESDLGEYWKRQPQQEAAESIQYAKTGSGDVKMLQDEMRRLQEAGDYKGAQQVQDELRAARSGNVWSGKK